MINMIFQINTQHTQHFLSRICCFFYTNSLPYWTASGPSGSTFLGGDPVNLDVITQRTQSAVFKSRKSKSGVEVRIKKRKALVKDTAKCANTGNCFTKTSLRFVTRYQLRKDVETCLQTTIQVN